MGHLPVREPNMACAVVQTTLLGTPALAHIHTLAAGALNISVGRQPSLKSTPWPVREPGSG